MMIRFVLLITIILIVPEEILVKTSQISLEASGNVADQTESPADSVALNSLQLILLQNKKQLVPLKNLDQIALYKDNGYSLQQNPGWESE